jgi:hypothetical protein
MHERAAAAPPELREHRLEPLRSLVSGTGRLHRRAIYPRGPEQVDVRPGVASHYNGRVASKRQRRYRDRRRSGRAPLSETEIERAEARRKVEAARPQRAKPAAGASTAGPKDPRGRPIRIPSWTRPLKLAPIFLVFWFVLTRYVTKSSGTTTQGAAIQAVLLTVVLVPAMYLSDRMAYRIAMRRLAKTEAAAPAKRS